MMAPCRFTVFLRFISFVLIFLLFGCKTSPPSAPADTAPTATITSPGAYEYLRLTDTVFVDASDDRAVTKVELYINGQLSSTDNTAPWRFVWNTEQWDDGDYVLQAKAYDEPGHTGTSDAITVTVSNAFPATFINSTYTTMSITVANVQRSILPGDSTTYTFLTNPRTLSFSAITGGSTSSGTLIGVALSWVGSGIDVSNEVQYRTRLVVSSNYFFMYLKNTGHTTLGPVTVNYGLTDETTDNIAIPGDGNTYQTGYYKAYTNTEVRAYWSSPYSGYYSYWDQGTNFTFSWTTNQSVLLLNADPLSKTGTANFAQSQDSPAGAVLFNVPIAAKSSLPRIPDDGAVLAYPRK
jgi:hypothetical protein